MRLFSCQSCGQTLFFENIACERCGHALGFSAEAMSLLTLEQDGEPLRAVQGNGRFRYCDNVSQGACNWLVPAESPERFCEACRHNRTIPDLSDPDNLRRWQAMEVAKHRLFYTLLRLGLKLDNLVDDPEHGLAFDFLADPPGPGPRILTGHDEGLITINLNEADDAMREKFRAEMGEPYRTLLGHFRHEVGHYYWNVLVRDAVPDQLEACRAVFGDDRQDYAAALQTHYEQGPPPGWEDNFISAYATTHPWEDFAETWAHYLHIVDTLETASAFGLRIHPKRGHKILNADIDFDPHRASDIHVLVDAWLPLSFAVNSLNRSMGHADLYPFVLSAGVIGKLGFIHDLVHGRARAQTGPKRGLFGIGRKQAAPNPPPPSQPPSPPGPSPVRPPIEPPPAPGPDIEPPVEEPPSELPPTEIPPPPPGGEPPPLQA